MSTKETLIKEKFYREFDAAKRKRLEKKSKEKKKKRNIFKEAKLKKQKEEKEKEKLKRIHSSIKGKRDLDEPTVEQKLKDIKGRIKRNEDTNRSGKVIRYKEGEYKGRLRNLATDKDYDPINRYSDEEWQKKVDRDKKLYGGTVYKDELGAAKGMFVKKKRISSNDYRKGGLFLSTVNNRKK